MIKFENVFFKYSNSTKNVLENINLNIKKGSWTSILGENGSGKSTLMKLLYGQHKPTDGKILINGTEYTEEVYDEIRNSIAVVFQNPDNQFVGATVEDDVAFGLENQGLPREEMRKRVAESLELVGMLDFKKREPARLSGGQKQRVAIAGVVALRPAILILDEATSMLDPEGRRELIQTVQEIRKDNQMTVVSITHDLEEVAMSDRVLVMKKGQVESTSSPRELFSRDDLDQIGLDEPFTNRLRESLREAGYQLPDGYLTEGELEDKLWELL